jgi:hypothetical protein
LGSPSSPGSPASPTLRCVPIFAGLLLCRVQTGTCLVCSLCSEFERLFLS